MTQKTSNIIQKTRLHLVFAVSLLTLTACGGGGGGGNDPQANAGDVSVAVRSKPLPAGDADCPNGGILVESGIDENGNGQLDDNEVDKTEKVCNGQDGSDGQNGSNGLNSLVAFSDEPAGSNCPYGGMRVDSGLDDNGNGTLDSGEIDQTGFVCSHIAGEIGWQVAELIETDNAGDAWSPQITFDASGNAIAVWRQSDGTRYNIWANRYTPATGWGTAELIETDDGTATYPNIAIDANGNAIAVWYQHDGTRYNTWANRYAASSASWGKAEKINDPNSPSSSGLLATPPQIAFDANGNAFVLWAQLGGNQFLWSNRFIFGSGWATAQFIEPEKVGGYPNIASDSDGNIIAVWEQFDGTRYNIWANRYTGSGWGTAELIETSNAGDAINSQIAMDSNGNAIAVWEQSDGSHRSIWAKRYTPGSGWGTMQLIKTDNAGNASNPQIAIDANGNAIAVWEQTNGTGFLSRKDIWTNHYTTNSGSWGTAQLIETSNAGSAEFPQISIDANGNAIAVWVQYDGTRYNIWANRYTLGTGWGTAELIETDNAGYASDPQIAIDANGNAIAVWRQYDGTRYNIWANRWLAP